MTFYLDASVVVALLTPEIHSDRADAWFVAQQTAALFVSPWVGTEVSSALSIKLRIGALSFALRANALAQWRQMLSENVLVLAVADGQFETAAAFADQHEWGLRAGDALHLAIAANAGCTLVTFDRVMATAAPHAGVPVATL